MQRLLATKNTPWHVLCLVACPVAFQKQYAVGHHDLVKNLLFLGNVADMYWKIMAPPRQHCFLDNSGTVDTSEQQLAKLLDNSGTPAPL